MIAIGPKNSASQGDGSEFPTDPLSMRFVGGRIRDAISIPADDSILETTAGEVSITTIVDVLESQAIAVARPATNGLCEDYLCKVASVSAYREMLLDAIKQHGLTAETFDAGALPEEVDSFHSSLVLFSRSLPSYEEHLQQLLERNMAERIRSDFDLDEEALRAVFASLSERVAVRASAEQRSELAKCIEDINAVNLSLIDVVATQGESLAPLHNVLCDIEHVIRDGNS